MGLHSGPAIPSGSDYVAFAVHQAARVVAAAHGGQVLVSSATRALLPDDVPLTALGRFRLRDFDEPEALYELAGSESFPAPRALPAATHNFPLSRTSFVGRERELGELRGMLVRSRLVTVTGPGGTGKTRLALQAAADAAEHFPDGLWWIPLASLRDPALAISAIAHVLGVRAMPGRSLAETVTDALVGSRSLLLLDNAEHLLPAVATEISVLRTADGPTLLVTSRERLQLQGEEIYDVPALAEPDGVALFLARASALNRSFTPTAVVAELCDRLDELPLAIELAAARTRLFSPAQLLERLGERLDLLKGGRDADPRQRTLRATIEWSHDLLAPDEQALFRRLAVFAGGCTYAAAEAVCGAHPDTLQSLVDKSLIRLRDDLGDELRFSTLETIREYAAQRLARSGKAEEVGEAHAAWYAALAARLVWPARFGEAGAIEALDADLANVRVALANAVARHDVGVAGDCLFGLWYHWLTHGLGREAKDSVQAWLTLDRSALTPLERMPGLLACGEVLRYTGDLQRATEVKHEQLAIARAHPAEVVHGRELFHIVAATLSDLAQMELAAGNLPAARASAEEALAIRRERGEAFGIGHALVVRGRIALVECDLQRARTCFAEGVEALRDSPDDHEEATLLLAECELLLGDAKASARRLGACVDRLREVENVNVIADAARVAGMLALERGDPETGAELTGAFAAILENAGVALSHDAHWQRSYETMTQSLRARLTADALGRARNRGADLSEEEVLELVAALASGTTPS